MNYQDELLAVCETIHEWLGTDDAAQALPFEPPWYQQLRDAIARAKREEEAIPFMGEPMENKEVTTEDYYGL